MEDVDRSDKTLGEGSDEAFAFGKASGEGSDEALGKGSDEASAEMLNLDDERLGNFSAF